MDGHGGSGSGADHVHDDASPMAADEVLSPSQALRLIRLYMSDLARESGNGAGGGDGHEAAIQPDDGGDGQFTILHIHGSTTGTGDDDGVGVGGEYNDGTFMMTVHMVHIHSHAGAGEEEGLGVGSEEGAYRDGGFGAVPASRAAIDGLPEAAANDAAVREASCAVCLESLVPSSDGGGRIKKMPCCSNGFHERCIADWLRVSRLCPCCRFALPAAAEEDNDDGDMEEGEVRGFRPYVLHLEEEDDGELEEGELRDSSESQEEEEDDDEMEEEDDDDMEEGEFRVSNSVRRLEEEDDDDVEDELDDWMEYDEQEEEDDDDDAYGAKEDDYML